MDHNFAQMPTASADSFAACLLLTIFAFAPIEFIDSLTTMLLHLAQLGACGITLFIGIKSIKNKK